MGEETYNHVFVDVGAGDLTTRLAQAGGSLPTPTGGITGRLGGETDDDDEPAQVLFAVVGWNCALCAVIRLCSFGISHAYFLHTAKLPTAPRRHFPAFT
jgi:hypothetical protein